MELNVELIRDYCLDKPFVTESFPFDDQTLVFKVCGKMFLLIGLENPNSFNVKCDPELAIALREKYTEVQPGYHMNKQHWNTVSINGRLTKGQLLEMIDHSYALVLKGVPKAKRG